MKDFSLFDEKCGTCLTIGYLASAAVAAILAGLVGGSFLTQVVIFVVAAAVLGYAANRYCMGRMADEIAEEESSTIVKRPAPEAKAKSETAAESAVEVSPSPVAGAAGKDEEGAAEIKETATRPARPEAADPGDDASGPARDPVAPDDRRTALDAARTAAEEQAKTRAAMQKAVDALNARKSE